MTAICHDYRLAPSPKGYLCLNEVEFGAPLKPPMAAIFRVKLPADVFRDMVLEARRFTGQEAVARGLADGLTTPEGGVGDALRLIEERKLVGKAKSGVYGVLKAEMWNELVWGVLRKPGLDREEERFEAMQRLGAGRRGCGGGWYAGWEREKKEKSKL